MQSVQPATPEPDRAPTPVVQATNGHAPQDADEPPTSHTTDDFETALDTALKVTSAIRFRRDAAGQQEFIKLVELGRPRGLGLDADARKDALGGMTVNKYMVDQDWKDDPAALDRVWAVLEAKVRATEAAEVAATE